jgi:hypothetical protein
LGLEGGARHAVENLGNHVLLQFLPVIVDAGLLIEKERFGLLDLALNADLLGDAVDLLAAGSALDFDLGRVAGPGAGAAGAFFGEGV